jgi:hypothetical protein
MVLPAARAIRSYSCRVYPDTIRALRLWLVSTPIPNTRKFLTVFYFVISFLHSYDINILAGTLITPK